ncbi:hypothetical protein HED60_06580 [Planctomycetales bacterium ZRK34]|nr:hypothetical protein HED60_06580 [Planctomycetales bacterium ZRK34]
MSRHQRIGILLVGCLYSLAGVTVCAQESTNADSARPSGGADVAVVRFGVIEPPVVSQADITVRAAVSNQNPEVRPLECSGLDWCDGHLIMTSDRHGHVVFVSRIDEQTMTFSTPEPRVVIANEQQLLDDAEAIAMRHLGSRCVAYVMCSMSNDKDGMPLPKRRHMLRFDFTDPTKIDTFNNIVINLTPVREMLRKQLAKAGVKPYLTYNAAARANTYRWANTEAIAVAPGTESLKLLCGMRNPLHNDRAIMYVLAEVDEALDHRDAGAIQVVDLFSLDLGGRGVSGLNWDPVTRGYLIAAGKSNGPKLDENVAFPPNSLDCALFWWSGVKSEEPILFAKAPDMKIEAITRLGESRYIAIASDEGDVSEGRPERQSVLTIMEFTGVK